MKADRDRARKGQLPELRAEILRGGTWHAMRAARLELRLNEPPRLRGQHGGDVAPPWRVLLGDTIVATDAGEHEITLDPAPAPGWKAELEGTDRLRHPPTDRDETPPPPVPAKPATPTYAP